MSESSLHETSDMSSTGDIEGRREGNDESAGGVTRTYVSTKDERDKKTRIQGGK